MTFKIFYQLNTVFGVPAAGSFDKLSDTGGKKLTVLKTGITE